jgi:hypothetical protein
MSLDSILALVRDILVVGYLFVLRIGVPLIITLMLGTWLRKLLEEKEKPAEVEQPQAEPAAVRPN